MNWGSLFFAEIVRTMSSSSPGGVESDSTAETNPYGYTRLANSSMIFWLPLLLMRCPSCLSTWLSVPPSRGDGDWEGRIYNSNINSDLAPISTSAFSTAPPPRRQYRGGPSPPREPVTRSGSGVGDLVPVLAPARSRSTRASSGASRQSTANG